MQERPRFFMHTFFVSPSRRRAAPWAAALAVALFIAGCTAPPPKPERPAPRPVPSMGWVGSYYGTVPCTPPVSSTCTAQQLVLTLLPSHTYRLQTTVQRRGKPYTIASNGRFQWDATGTVITLASKDENARLRIANGTAERLPGINDDITDVSAYRGYVLRKQ